ncbi:MAG TPA: hypothetical protein VEK79_13530 [Thermoanaerobaculia bacterium]|nr:hypothetical protein [Thermoanaerobaculia bacterium]
MSEDRLVGQQLHHAIGDVLGLRNVRLVERLPGGLVAHVDDADQFSAHVQRRGEQAVGRRFEQQLREPRLGGDAVDEERVATAAAAIDERIVVIRLRAYTALPAELRDQLEAAVAVEEIQSRFRRADLDRAIVEVSFNFG